jgi:phenylalanyl-tRNA synthetase beta chain
MYNKHTAKSRKYSIGFVATGHAISEDDLLTLIQSQEKLCTNYGRKRKTVALGIYRSDLIQFPIHYEGADPDTTAFVPLGMEEKLTLRDILKKHPKGIEYASLLAEDDRFPYLFDDNGEALSFPPVINSAKLGAVKVGDENLFVEMSGPLLKNLLLVAAILSCDMVDMGFTIKPVKVVLDEESEFGREITVPYYYQDPIMCTKAQAHKTLGIELSDEEIIASLKRMGVFALAQDDEIYATVPEYRDDFLHAADLVEDIMIGYGLNNIEPEMPHDFTMGRISDAEALSRKIRSLMVGLGFQEMMYNYLGSKKSYIDKMCVDGSQYIQIMNPMSENYEYVRPSILPSMLDSESISASAAFPHKIFEIGKVAYLDPSDNSGTTTRNNLGFMVSDTAVGYNEISALINNLLYFLRLDYTLDVLEDPRYIEGRCANIICGGKVIGHFGEIHPQVLENWNCSMPTVACELDIDVMLSLNA